MTTYVFENIEVEKTGRKAVRTLSSKKLVTVVEIKPKNDRDGLWHKWVPEDTLYVVQDETTNDNPT